MKKSFITSSTVLVYTGFTVCACTTDINNKLGVGDLFHVYLNRFEFHFLRLHINKTNNFCF